MRNMETLIDYDAVGGYFHPLKVIGTERAGESFRSDDIRLSILGEDEENGFMVLTIWNHEGGLVYDIRPASEEEASGYDPMFC